MTTPISFSKMSHQQIHEFVGAQARSVSEQWFQQQCRNNCASIYVWYRPRELCAAADKPGPDWTLATGERIRPGSTKERVFRWVNDLAQRIPFLIDA